MVKKIRQWLQRPYYINKSKNFWVNLSFGIGFFIFSYLIVFTPAGIEQIPINSYLFRLGFAIIPTIVLLFYFFVITKRFPKYFDEKKWTVGKHLLNIFLILLACALLNWLYTLNTLPAKLYNKNTSFLDIVGSSLSVGIFPMLVFIYFNERYFDKKFKNTAKKISNLENHIPVKTITKKIKTNKQLTIYASNKKDKLQFKINNLIYVTSEANYACFFIKSSNEVKEYILRMPLQKVEQKLQNFEHIFRCHKSYIVNLKYIQKVSGNARGFFLHSNDIEEPIPVSRKITKDELSRILKMV